VYNEIKVRTVSNSIMAALVVVALFWGNCLSCPQLLAALHSHQPAHGCCHKTQPASSACQTQLLKSFVKAETSTPAPSLPVMARLVETPAAADLTDSFVRVEEHTLPDLLSLHSSFRI
jgi:hypothetical protein